MDDLQTMMHALQRYPGRVAMWHEGGHAVAAMHYGLRVWSYGLDPLPHCLVNSLTLNKHQKGVLLCAGAAMTKAVFGFEWGGDVTDWKMAQSLGNLKVFKTEAEVLVKSYLPEAKFLVEGRLGKFEDDPRRVENGPEWVEWLGTNPEATVGDLTTDSLNYALCVRVVNKAKLGKTSKRLLGKAASLQMANPQLVARLNALVSRSMADQS
jgi:hypothetical protein